MFLRWVLVLIVLLLQGGVQAQQKSLPDQLAECEAWLRVKQDTPCRCDQVERVAAALLVRAERAEKALAEVQRNGTTDAPTGKGQP
jgi:hypothetical protein